MLDLSVGFIHWTGAENKAMQTKPMPGFSHKLPDDFYAVESITKNSKKIFKQMPFIW